MNLATLIGVFGGIAILVFATYSSTESVRIFLNLPGIAIVLGGVTAATFVCYSLKDVACVFHGFIEALRREEGSLADSISEIQRLAAGHLRKGQRYLEQEIDGIENDFLRDGIQMVIDRDSPEDIRQTLEGQIENTFRRGMAEARVFRTMAKLSPTFGIIGTLIGLIGMMQNMDVNNISQIGLGMAVALTTTFYGVLLSSLVFYPIAVKLEKRLEDRILSMSMILEGVLLIRAKTPPALVRDHLKGFLPPGKWVSVRFKERESRQSAIPERENATTYGGTIKAA